MRSVNERTPKIWSLLKAEVLFNSAILPHEKAAYIRECYFEDGGTYFFPIGRLARDLDIDVFVDDLSEFDGIGGYLAIKTERRDVIVVDGSCTKEYKRWTIARLLWYYLNNKNRVKKDTFFEQPIHLVNKSEEEKDSNQFALCLLAPEDLLSGLLGAYSDEPETIRKSLIMECFGIPAELYKIRKNSLKRRKS